MSLGTEQRAFTRDVAKLISWAYSHGYELSLGDGYRDPRVFGAVGETKGYGHPKSNHKRRLAVDLNLFKDGSYLSATKDHEPLGTYWETLHPHNRWGGRYNDGNHYERCHTGWR